MGIWRVLKASIICDKCEKLIAVMEFDAADELNIEHINVYCLECKSGDEPNAKEEIHEQ